jgi:hypothetical protein
VNEICAPDLRLDLLDAWKANLQRAPGDRKARIAWWFENDALKRLLLALRPPEAFAAAMRDVAEFMAETGDKQALKESQNLLRRGLLSREPVLARAEAFDAVGPPLLAVVMSDRVDYKEQRAGSLLASLSTPLATQALLDALEAGTFHFPDVLREIHDPESADMLGTELRKAKDYRIAGVLVEALVNSGEEGLGQLREILKSRVHERGHVSGAALNGLASNVRTAKDLDLIEQCLVEIPSLEPTVRSCLGSLEFSEKTAEAVVDYIAEGRLPLQRGAVAALAGWPNKDATPYLQELKARNPAMHRKTLLERERLRAQHERLKARVGRAQR